MSKIVDELLSVLAEAGAERYGDERISQLQHALQSAALAEADNAPPALIAAALLHDVGHLVDRHAERAARKGIDRRHETIGSGYLASWFPPEVSEPVRLHVAAKRYLCAVDKAYAAGLSPASVRSLELQGGPFTAPEAEAFLRLPYAADAVALRRWDDLAKRVSAVTPPLEHYRACLETCLRPKTAGGESVDSEGQIA